VNLKKYGEFTPADVKLYSFLSEVDMTSLCLAMLVLLPMETISQIVIWIKILSLPAENTEFKKVWPARPFRTQFPCACCCQIFEVSRIQGSEGSESVPYGSTMNGGTNIAGHRSLALNAFGSPWKAILGLRELEVNEIEHVYLKTELVSQF
jgi:hypothetical protein